MLNKILFGATASIALLLSSQVSAVELVDVEAVPSRYASMQDVKDPETGESKKELRFGNRQVFWQADDWNDILNGYGLELTEEHTADMPKGFCRTVEKTNEEGETERVIVFNSADSTIYTPESLNRILNAYGVSLDVNNEDAMANVPSSYARVVEQQNDAGETVKVAVFGNSNITWKPNSFNQIMAAYN